MTDDSLARPGVVAPPRMDPEYDAIHATVVATARGRWFLDEYARRCRGADTEQVLAAVGRIEQALGGGNAPDPADAVAAECAAMSEAIERTRSEVIARNGDPAASGEAAIADFRNAAEQIRQLMAETQGQNSDLGGQLSFQINRLASAGERLERSIAALRALLELVEGLDQRLRQLVSGPEGEAAGPPRPAEAFEAEAPADPEDPEAPPASAAVTNADESPPQPDTDDRGEFWSLAVARPEPDRGEAEASADAPFEAGASDWAFLPADRESEPPPDAGQLPSSLEATDPSTDPSMADPSMSALERLEAREYDRQGLTAVGAGPTPAPPAHADLDDLTIGRAEAGLDSDTPDSPASDLDWAAQPTERAAEPPAAGPILDVDLFDIDGGDTAAGSEARDPVPDAPAGASQTSAQGASADMPSVLQRLEGMRTAIAELTDEVNAKTARRNRLLSQE